MLYMKHYFIPRQTANEWKLPQEFTLKLALFATPFIPVSLLWVIQVGYPLPEEPADD